MLLSIFLTGHFQSRVVGHLSALATDNDSSTYAALSLTRLTARYKEEFDRYVGTDGT